MPTTKPASNQYYALRHGESDKNVPVHLAVNYPEVKPYHLTKRGREQVRQAADWLLTKKIDLIISSDLTRTKDTAEIVAQVLKVPVIYDERLREIDHGIYNDRSIAELHAFFEDHNDVNERFAKSPPAGENWRQLLTRVMNFLKDVENKYQGKNILIVSHGDPLWLLEWGSQCLTKSELPQMPYPQTGAPVKMKIDCPVGQQETRTQATAHLPEGQVTK